MTALKHALLGLLALPLAACAVGPDYKKPDLALTPAYFTPTPVNIARPASLDAWWEGFGDPELVKVVERATAANLGLAQALARVQQSRAVAKAAGAALAPQASATGSVADVQQSLLSPIGEIGSHLPGFQRDYDDYGLGLAANWQIDVSGGLRRERDAARADARAAADQAVAVRLTVAADAADAYLQVRAYQARIAVARRQEAVQVDLVDLLTRRTRDGVTADRELHEAQAALEGVRASIPPLQAGLDAELNRLDVLMGAQPGTYRTELASDAGVPSPPGLNPGDGPADLLRRRPDVLAAEQRLIAANARIGAAISDYYPKVSITGLLGLDSLDATRLFSGLAVAHQVGVGLSWRLFDFGRVDAEVAQARGADAEALAAYRATVLNATEEVEDSFSSLIQDEAQADALTRQIDQLTLARAQAEQAYQGGVDSLIEVRDADRDLLNASDQLVQARAGAARAAVASFRALGGGWRPI